MCIAGPSGDFEVEASGLQPRSVSQLASDKLGDSSYTIMDAGEPDGRVGLLGDLDDEIIVMSAVAESGEPLSGELTPGNGRESPTNSGRAQRPKHGRPRTVRDRYFTVGAICARTFRRFRCSNLETVCHG